MPKHKQSLPKTLESLSKVVDESASAITEASVGDPLFAVTNAKKILEKWKDSGAEAVFGTDDEYRKFCGDIGKQLSLQLYTNLTQALGILSTRLEKEEIPTRDLAGIISELGRQLDIIKKREFKEKLPDTEEDLDRELQELESQLHPHATRQ